MESFHDSNVVNALFLTCYSLSDKVPSGAIKAIQGIKNVSFQYLVALIDSYCRGLNLSTYEIKLLRGVSYYRCHHCKSIHMLSKNFSEESFDLVYEFRQVAVRSKSSQVKEACPWIPTPNQYEEYRDKMLLVGDERFN